MMFGRLGYDSNYGGEAWKTERRNRLGENAELAISLIPVSYTHLDVYKRQAGMSITGTVYKLSDAFVEKIMPFFREEVEEISRILGYEKRGCRTK